MSSSNQRNLEITWPLFGDQQPFPADVHRTFTDFEPPASDLQALETAPDDSESEEERVKQEVRRMRQSLAPSAPEWMRAARALADWLETRIKLGKIAPVEEAKLARTWAAFALGGLTERHILQMAKVVQRAHTAIREAPESTRGLEQAISACAGVLYAGLPRPVRERMPLERVIAAVSALRHEADPWAAIVEGVSDIAGWRDYARIHAASIIRTVVEAQR